MGEVARVRGAAGERCQKDQAGGAQGAHDDPAEYPAGVRGAADRDHDRRPDPLRESSGGCRRTS
jgi:hypothetical protein